MKSALQTLLPDIGDEHIRELIDDLCQMLGWRADHYPEHTLRSFLETVFSDDPKRVKLSFIPAPRVVDQKLGKLQDHGVYAVCRELKNGRGLELDAGKKLFTFLETHFKNLRRPLPKRRRR
jgi:hypothetical protein